MVIGPFLDRARACGAMLGVLAVALPSLHSAADDQIRKKDGTVITGKIVGVANNQVLVETRSPGGGLAKFPTPLEIIDSVNMAVPAAVASAKGAAPAAVVQLLDPVVKMYGGLPSDWVVGAMSQLAQAYSDQGQAEKAGQIYQAMGTLYASGKYHAQAVAGVARMEIKEGKAAEAITELQPVIDQANVDIAPSAEDGKLYADAFLVYGNALEAQKQPQKALEAYLTVKTMFYQNPVLAQQADLLAKNLRDHNPALGVE